MKKIIAFLSFLSFILNNAQSISGKVLDEELKPIENVRIGIGSDTRIGKRFLFAGIGYGGSCFPKDVQALVHSAAEVNYDFKILKAVEDVNYDQKKALLPKIDAHYGNINGKTVAMPAASAGVGSLSWGNLDIRLGLRYSSIKSDLSGQI